ncbi:MAG: 6-bladed beta-propeller [Acidobacteria bacterium]|nr:6-bladed beta-propeller [Acidobacteriota bacterium]
MSLPSFFLSWRSGVVLCVLLLFAWLQPAHAQCPAATASTFLLKFGKQGAGDGELNNPVNAVVNAAGSIIVADSLNHRIEVFDASGNFLRKFGQLGTNDGEFNQPFDVAVNAAGSIIVADNVNSRIQVFDANGNFLFKFGQAGSGDGEMINPTGVAVNAAGNIIVADHGNNRIEVFDANGNFLRKFGQFGSGNGEFNDITGLAVNGTGEIVVLENGNHRVQVFDANGNFLRKFGSLGTGDGQFRFMIGVEATTTGNIIVTDSENHRIQVFDASGNFLFKFGSMGMVNNSEFYFPEGAAVNAAGNIIIVDTGNHRVQVFAGCPSYTAPNLNVQAGGRGNNLGANLGDPAICLDPGGLVGINATVTNPNNVPLPATFTATLPAGLTAIAGTCAADVNPGGCTIAANGSTVSWNGNLNAGQTVNIIYRARVDAGVANGITFTIQNQGSVGGVIANLNYQFTLSCPLTNTRLSDQKAGSVLVFPYYTSTIGGASDTRMSISNIGTGTGTTNVHLFLIDGTTCQQADLYLCLTPNASFSFKASDYDPGNTGFIIAVAVDNQGLPVNNNVLVGNAFVNTPTFADNYGAESFRANAFSAGLYTVSGNAATLYFDHVGYDAVPKQFAVEIQSPLDAAGQQVVTAGLSGNLVTSQLSGATQVGIGQAYNEKEVFASFSSWLTGACQARATISTTSPRVPNGLGILIKAGQSGYLKFNVGAAVGLLMTPRTATWKGIRTLHKTQTTTTTLTIPIFVPIC